MSNLAKLANDWRPKKCSCNIIIETPKGRRNKFNYDPDAIFRDIKEQEKRSGRRYVSFADEGVAPNQALQPTEAAISVSQESKSQEAAPAAEL